MTKPKTDRPTLAQLRKLHRHIATERQRAEKAEVRAREYLKMLEVVPNPGSGERCGCCESMTGAHYSGCVYLEIESAITLAIEGAKR